MIMIIMIESEVKDVSYDKFLRQGNNNNDNDNNNDSDNDSDSDNNDNIIKII